MTHKTKSSIFIVFLKQTLLMFTHTLTHNSFIYQFLNSIYMMSLKWIEIFYLHFNRDDNQTRPKKNKEGERILHFRKVKKAFSLFFNVWKTPPSGCQLSLNFKSINKIRVFFSISTFPFFAISQIERRVFIHLLFNSDSDWLWWWWWWWWRVDEEMKILLPRIKKLKA